MGSIPIKRTRGVIDTPSNLNVAQKHDRKRRWDDGHRSENNSRGSRRRVGHDSVDTRRTQVAPAVPSFGWSLKNLKSDVNNSSGCSALVKNIANPCPSNQLGLTPQVRDEDTALVDEESVALLSGTTSSA